MDAAHVLLLIDSARQYGLITGGPEVNQERAAAILREGAECGYTPSEDALER